MKALISDKFETEGELLGHYMEDFRGKLLDALLDEIKGLSYHYSDYQWQTSSTPKKLREAYSECINSANFDNSIKGAKELIRVLNLTKARTNFEHFLTIEKQNGKFFMLYQKKDY